MRIIKCRSRSSAENEIIEDSDGVFLFPSEFQTLIEPLRIYLNHLFKEARITKAFCSGGCISAATPSEALRSPLN